MSAEIDRIIDLLRETATFRLVDFSCKTTWKRRVCITWAVSTLVIASFLLTNKVVLLAMRNLSNPSPICLSNLLVLCCLNLISTASLLKVQNNRHLRKLPFRVHRSLREEITIRRVHRAFSILEVMILISDLFIFAYLEFGMSMDEVENEVASSNRFMRSAHFATVAYQLIASAKMLQIFCYCTLAVKEDVQNFNADIGQVEELDSEALVERFTEFMRRHSKIADSVKIIDGVFKHFVFSMVLLSFPSLIFGTFVIGAQMRSDFASFGSFIFIPRQAISCIFYCSILWFPAELHSQIKKSASIFGRGMHKYMQCDRKVHLSATALCQHLHDPGLGVSFWGFALITKGFILGTFSVEMTMVAMLLQFEDCSKGNQTADWSKFFNGTAP